MKAWLVSGRAYRLLLDERDRLRHQNDGLIETYKRIQRVRSGMRETPPTPRPEAQRPVTLPTEIKELLSGFRKPVSDTIERQVRSMHANGTPFEEIHKVLEKQLLTEEVN